jgi:DNA-binding SARP family transcriptional activator
LSGTLCRVEVFGGLRLIVGGQVVTRFRTEKTALLLAYLATHLHQSHPREVLIDLLWPDSDVHSGRTSLRVAVSALRKLFEEHDVVPERVFYTDNFGIGLRTSAVATDLQMMERSLRLARHSSSVSERKEHLARAVRLYTDLPLKGYYEDWVLQLQQQISERYFRALDELVKILEAEGDLDIALEYALNGIAQDPLREEPHLALVRNHLARGYPAEARKAYAEWERLLQEDLESTPSRETLMLAQAIDSAAQQAHQTTEAMCWSALPPAPGRLV